MAREVTLMSASLLGVILLSYLLGSIPFSHLVAHWRTGLVLREVGEGNVGSRNVWHVAGPSWGVLAGALDMSKGLVSYLGAAAIHAPPPGVVLTGFAVLVGHQFPLFLRGQGGKGLATSGGFMLGISPLSTIAGLILMGLAFLFFHDFNPSIVVGAVSVILLPLLFRQPLWVTGFALGLGMIMGAKKLLDRPHEAEVWASQPWQGEASPGWREPCGDAPPTANT